MTSKLNRFSPSMINTYINCPILFYYRYIAKIHLKQKQIHLLFGGAIHKAVECIYDKIDPFQPFIQHFQKEKLLDEEKDQHEEFLKLGHEMIRNYIETHKTISKLYDLDSGKSELYVRRYLKNPLTDEISSLPMSGIIDRLTSDGKIVEYKTSKNKWKQDDVNYKIQTLLYNLWYYSENNILPTETIYIILLKKYKYQGRGETYQVLSNHYTLEDLANTFEEIELILQKINNGEFERPSGYHPSYCDCYKYEKELSINKS